MVRRRSDGYASRASRTWATRSGSATSAIPQWAVPSWTTALTTTSPTATELARAVSRKSAPGAAASGRRALTALDTEPPSQVVDGSRARDRRQVVEVVRRRRRGRVPLERVRLPRVVADPRASAGRPEDVDHEQQYRDPHHVRADGGREVVPLPALVRVRVDAARHPLEPEEELREEGDVEADEQQPELPLAEGLPEFPAEHLRPPVEESREDREHHTAEERVVEVGDDEVAVVHLPVDREGGEVDPRETSDHEDREEAERVQERRVEMEVAAPEGREPVEDLDPRRDGDHHRRDH